MKNQGNPVSEKENNSPATKLKSTIFCDLTDHSVKSSRRLKKTQEIWNNVNEQKDFFTKEI